MTAAAVERLTGCTVLAGPRGHPPRFELAGVGEVVLKDGGDAPGSVAAETAGLRWLAVPGGPPVPPVHGADPTLLVTGHVRPGRPSPAAAEDLGGRLAVLHAAGATAFGAPPPGGPADAWIGRARMRNVAHEGPWGDWFAGHRVLPYLRTARDRGAVDAAGTAAVEIVRDRIAALAGPDEPPARLHGDLWSGNVLWSADGAVHLIDPAAHGGHRESDLAMLDLFGLPHLDRVLAAYDERAPLADGWRERVGLHQLFPLLVHTVLFGGGYAERAVGAARRVRALLG
ncbi:fructosamine kinase family protein [Pseudonocardia sp. HH130630-07]|uniref:fructosamine kinase family protein n=1 Tax=Pseudonocardia sp. HH130630-07 TaxID=1690815 RepID=UPI0008151FAB|nr:fructosamine kinase family protein [Pseudonocardia sp. HH130630-07]ANY08627.1 fructosamine kinase [Pseudonocardia sp. HH130630-07]